MLIWQYHLNEMNDKVLVELFPTHALLYNLVDIKIWLERCMCGNESGKTDGDGKKCTLLQMNSFSNNAIPAISALSNRISESNPLKHDYDDCAMFYSIPSSEKKEMFSYGGLPKSFENNIETFGEACLMVRKPALEIINCMKKTDFDRPVVRYLLYGKPGCGKSLTMAHIIHYAYCNEFIILHVPWVWNWFSNARTEVINSSGSVALPLIAAHWLKHFQTQNEKIMNTLNLTTTKDYIWNQRESTSAGSKLQDLVSYGINRVKYAVNCVDAIVSEIKEASTLKKCKTLVAIDGFNALFGEHTNLKTEDKIIVKPSTVTLTKTFLEVCKQDWTNGSVVVTVDQMAAKYNSLTSYLPLYLLGKKGFEHIDPFIAVPVTELTNIEFHSMLDYYEDRKWFLQKKGREELAFLSNKNPYVLMNLCGPL